jgi:hypothetical protein
LTRPLATAFNAGAQVIEAYDADFLRVGEQGKVKGYPPIREPEWKGQLSLPETPPTPPAEQSTPADQPSD